MSGSVRISRGNAWTPPGWVFDNVLSDVAVEIEPHDAELARLVREAVDGFQYLDASGWQPQRLSLFLAAALESRRRRNRAGPAAFVKPEFFPGFVAELDRLIGQVEADPRIGRPSGEGHQSDVRTPPQV